MRNRELLARIDRHLEMVGDELRLSREARERSDKVVDRAAGVTDRAAEAIERNIAEHSDLREFMRELLLRLDRVLGANTEAVREQTAEIRELREESRAQTSALLRVIDKLAGPQPGGSSAAG